jgi:pyrroline-5-carboxylate reductase
MPDTPAHTPVHTPASTIAFIGGGNMATALIGGLVRAGCRPASILAIDPGDAARQKLQADFGVRTQPAADAALAGAGLVVWAVKPQLFAEAAAPCAAHAAGALHLSVMAGIRSDAIAAATGNERIVRAMPNTPALIGMGIAGLYACGTNPVAVEFHGGGAADGIGRTTHTQGWLLEPALGRSDQVGGG